MAWLTIAEAAQRLGRSPEMIRRWAREGVLRSQKFGQAVMIDEREVATFARRDDRTRRFYKISWIRWPAGDERAEWHFQPRVGMSDEFSCGNAGPLHNTPVDQARGVMSGLDVPHGRLCRECLRVARRMLSS